MMDHYMANFGNQNRFLARCSKRKRLVADMYLLSMNGVDDRPNSDLFLSIEINDDEQN